MLYPSKYLKTMVPVLHGDKTAGAYIQNIGLTPRQTTVFYTRSLSRLMKQSSFVPTKNIRKINFM